MVVQLKRSQSHQQIDAQSAALPPHRTRREPLPSRVHEQHIVGRFEELTLHALRDDLAIPMIFLATPTATSQH